MTPALASPIVLGPNSTGLARNEAREPVVVLVLPPHDVLFFVGAPSDSGYLTKADVVGTTCAEVFSEIVWAEREHFAGIGARADIRAKHVAVTADVWRVLCGDFGQTRMTGAEMLLRAMPWLDDVRVMSDGRPGTALIY